ncbi:SKP1/BTB/POZ domain-containing protein [Orpheovirus IHUMI-LCC2]|uniref:SKP1/BTB/POZ domain-containing protein n=1 Tax=Orpheovirus IHUMI-LCC2 TaxID=2023057 RepID=A0A2I2L487_9VIRU|nr:SKP1/BTB/POZ domain-containing protein [Orpheovirus IHUMI-LCC2]SNW62279.1 SKP1/BTB/POZ domain-containing protein [Orpheovirus IHUMI-LCC2]
MTTKAFNNPLYSDIILECIDGRQIYCHKVILFCKSEYFDIMFRINMKESMEKKIKLDISYGSLEIIIKYIYGYTYLYDDVYIPNKDDMVDNIEELLYYINMYNIEQLKLEYINYILANTKFLERHNLYIIFNNYNLIEYIKDKNIYKNKHHILKNLKYDINTKDVLSFIFKYETNETTTKILQFLYINKYDIDFDIIPYLYMDIVETMLENKIYPNICKKYLEQYGFKGKSAALDQCCIKINNIIGGNDCNITTEDFYFQEYYSDNISFSLYNSNILYMKLYGNISDISYDTVKESGTLTIRCLMNNSFQAEIGDYLFVYTYNFYILLRIDSYKYPYCHYLEIPLEKNIIKMELPPIGSYGYNYRNVYVPYVSNDTPCYIIKNNYE